MYEYKTCVGQVFRLVNKFNCEYIVKIDHIGSFYEGSIHADFWYDGKYCGHGAFPIYEIRLLEFLDETEVKEADLDAQVSRRDVFGPARKTTTHTGKSG